MEISHHYITPEKIDLNILNSLIDSKVYNPTGVMNKLYHYPEQYCKEEACLSVLSLENNPVSAILISKNEYYDWDSFFPHLKRAYGLIGFYTLPEYREKGYAKTLFNAFDNKFKVRKIGAVIRSESLLKSLSNSEKIFINDR